MYWQWPLIIACEPVGKRIENRFELTGGWRKGAACGGIGSLLEKDRKGSDSMTGPGGNWKMKCQKGGRHGSWSGAASVIRARWRIITFVRRPKQRWRH